MTNTARQSVTRTLRIQVLPQNDGIRNPITAVTTATLSMILLTWPRLKREDLGSV